MLITISGKAGSGKGTTSKLLESKFGYKRISIGELKRKLADEMGINIIEFNKLGEQPEKQQEFDLKYEEYQKSLDTKQDIILESRLGFYCQPQSFKVFLTVNDEIAAQRILGDNRPTDKFETLQDAIKETKERNETDRLRYIKLYNIDITDTNNFDLILDTSNLTIQQTCQAIIDKLPK